MTAPSPAPDPAPAGGSGYLYRKVALYLRDQPNRPHKVGEITKAIEAPSTGAVFEAAKRMVAAGHATHHRDPHHRFQITQAGIDAAGTIPATAGSRGGSRRGGKPAPITRPSGLLYYPRRLGSDWDVNVLHKLRGQRMPVLLYGPPGTGKTAMLEAAFPDLLTVAGTGDTIVDDFLGSYAPLPGGGYGFVYGPLVQAMREGRALLVDDATLIPPRVLAVLYPVMDGRGRITVTTPQGAETVEAVDGFYVCGGHNLPLTELAEMFSQLSDLATVPVVGWVVDDAMGAARALAGLAVPRVGQLRETGDRWQPYVLLDPAGEQVDAVAVFFRDMQAAGRSASTLRSYGMDLLRWFRFLWAIDVSWQRATRLEARDFSCWIAVTHKPRRGGARRAPGTVNAVTGKASPGPGYAETTRAHSETVLRCFYDLHVEMGSGPLVNPFPLDRSRRSGRANAHHNPMEPIRHDRKGLYRPTVPQRIPRHIPDEQFDAVFAALLSNRDRAMVAFWVSTGARAAELLGACEQDADVGQQLITVVRKGSRAVQQLPASPDAFVWLRLYQIELRCLGAPRGRREPLWWTLRRPLRPLTYHGAHRMFERVNAGLGANWSLHDLRHSAAYRMARDPKMPLTDVQWVLGHAHLSTTQLYTTPTRDEVIETVRAHHARYGAGRAEPAPPVPAAGYRPESLHTLFAR